MFLGRCSSRKGIALISVKIDIQRGENSARICHVTRQERWSRRITVSGIISYYRSGGHRCTWGRKRVLTHEHIIANVVVCTDIPLRIAEGIYKARLCNVVRNSGKKIRETRVQ